MIMEIQYKFSKNGMPRIDTLGKQLDLKTLGNQSVLNKGRLIEWLENLKTKH
jgi:hypothetical protein